MILPLEQDKPLSTPRFGAGIVGAYRASLGQGLWTSTPSVPNTQGPSCAGLLHKCPSASGIKGTISAHMGVRLRLGTDNAWERVSVLTLDEVE